MMNGTTVSLKDWPLLAKLTFKDRVEPWKVCSATISGRDELITAAHCVRNVTKTGRVDLLQVDIGKIFQFLFTLKRNYGVFKSPPKKPITFPPQEQSRRKQKCRCLTTHG